MQLWQLQNALGVHQLVWLSNFISFFFLYPSTFNLLEVAAVDKPKMHLWETGIMRITRHPQVHHYYLDINVHFHMLGLHSHLALSIRLTLRLFGVYLYNANDRE